MLLQSVRPDVVVEQEEQKRICDRFPCILNHARIESLYSSFLAIDLLESINDAFVFAVIGGG